MFALVLVMHQHLLLHNTISGFISPRNDRISSPPESGCFIKAVCLLRVTHLEVLSIKGQRSTDQGVQDDPQAPDVHLGAVVLLPLEELRCGVRRGAAEGVQLAACGKLVAESKVGDLDVGVCVQEQVLCLRGTSREKHGEMKRV